MAKPRTHQEWQSLIEQSESSSLSTCAFCKLNSLNPSTFYAKRQQLSQPLKPSNTRWGNGLSSYVISMTVIYLSTIIGQSVPLNRW